MSDRGYEYDSRQEVIHQVKEPARFKVILHNDDYTSMDFVVRVLRQVFKKAEEEATQIMLTIHRKGHGVCGVYTAEIAETKQAMVTHMARKEGFPLKCSLEEV